MTETTRTETSETAGMPVDRGRRRRPIPLTKKLAWIEAALFVFGVACLVWVAWSLLDAHRFQQRALEEVARSATEAGREPGGDEDLALPSGTPLARLEVPRLELSVAVAEGTSDQVLRRAVGHLRHTALPGEDGHVVLAGHRDTFFRPLERIELGDRVTVDAPASSEIYEVEWFRIIDPSEHWVLADPGYPALTLITCYPFRFVGNAPQRFIVRARRLEPSALADRTTTRVAAGG